MPTGFKLYLIPVLLLLAFTLPHLEQGEFRRDTVRYAAVSLNMWRSGTLLVPYLNSEKSYFNKPPMAFWIHGLALKLFGPRLAAARVPSILAAIGVVIFSMLAVRNLATRYEAVVSGIVLASTYEFFRRTREISLDFWQLFFVMIAVWLVTKAIRDNSRRCVFLAGFPIGLALLCKPLVALFALLIFAVWLGMSDRRRLIVWIFAGALPVAIAVAAPWHLYMYSIFGDRFVRQYFIQEIAARAQRTDQASSVFYYLKENVSTYWPWMLGLAWSVYLCLRRKGNDPSFDSTVSGLRWRFFKEPEARLILLGAIWVIAVLVALSLFADRKPNYALPIYPMLSWMVAWGLVQIQWAKFKLWYERGFPWLIPVTLAVFLVLTLAPIRFQQPPEKNWVALVEWLNANKIDVSQIGYASSIDQNDVSYVYLKTGQWMQNLAAARSRGASRGLAVLTKSLKPEPGASSPEEKPSSQTVLFASGPVRVISSGDR